jgi:hypothetical protein
MRPPTLLRVALFAGTAALAVTAAPSPGGNRTPGTPAAAATRPDEGGADVLRAAADVPDGGGYNRDWAGTGTPSEVLFGGQRVLAKGTGGTYCSGFTFAVAAGAAERRGLLAGKTIAQVKAFQKDWYGATAASRETQCAYAVERLGVGRAVAEGDARPGDFAQLWRVPGANGKPSGHSVVFVGWVVEGGRRVGLTYRSSQGSTGGVATTAERFADAPTNPGRVDRARVYFCRLAAGG